MAMRMVRLFLVMLGLLVFGTPVGAAGQELGPPPVWPESPAGLETPAREKESKLQELFSTGLGSVDPQSREASRLFFMTYYWITNSPIDWTGNRATCDAGATAPSFRDGVQLRLNYFRAMAGVPANVTFADTYNGKAQEAALMMSVNQQLSHYPPTSWSCYTADGAEAAHNSDIALGFYGRQAIDAYMDDHGVGLNEAVGHRRWVPFPPTEVMGTGDIPSVGGWPAEDLWVFDATSWGPRPPTREEYVAWPPPGFVPYQVVYPRWSFSYPHADFTPATVTVTQGNAGVPITLEPLHTGYGDNTLVWIPVGMDSGATWPQPSSDTGYQVTINNAIISGTPRSFTYYVTVFDPAIITPTSNPDVGLTLNQSAFHTSQQLTLSATVTPGSAPVNADVYVALRLPDGSLLFLLGGGSFTTAVQPIVSSWTIGPFSGQIFSYTFGGGEPAGNYTWLAGLTHPGTMNFIGPIVSAPFTFSP